MQRSVYIYTLPRFTTSLTFSNVVHGLKLTLSILIRLSRDILDT